MNVEHKKGQDVFTFSTDEVYDALRRSYPELPENGFITFLGDTEGEDFTPTPGFAALRIEGRD